MFNCQLMSYGGASLADAVCQVNNWGRCSLPINTLEIGLKHRQLDTVTYFLTSKQNCRFYSVLCSKNMLLFCYLKVLYLLSILLINDVFCIFSFNLCCKIFKKCFNMFIFICFSLFHSGSKTQREQRGLTTRVNQSS